MELYAEGTQTVDLFIDDGVRQTELGNTVLEHTANLVQCLEDMYLVAVLGGIAGKCQTRRTTTYDCNLLSLSSFRLRSFFFERSGLSIGIVRAETLQIADGYCRVPHLEVDTVRLALFLLRAHTAADSRERRTLFDHSRCAKHVAALQFLDETGDVDVHRTALYATRVLAVEAAVALRDSLLERQTLVHLFPQALHAHFGAELRHLHARNSHALFGRACEGLYGAKDDVGLFSLSSFELRSFFFERSVLITLHRLCFFRLVALHAAQHLVPVHAVGVELRTIDADELRLAAYRHAAGTAHTRAIDHDGVEGCLGGDVVFLGRQGDELHHDCRTDGDALVHFLAVDHLLHAYGHDAFLSGGTVVGHDNHLV